MALGQRDTLLLEGDELPQAHRTPLHYAGIWSMEEIMTMFIQFADVFAEPVVNIQDRFGSTALALVVSNCLEVKDEKAPIAVKTPQKRGAVSQSRKAKKGTTVLAKGAKGGRDDDDARSVASSP